MTPTFLGRGGVTLARLADTLLEGHPNWSPAASRGLALRVNDFLLECTRSSRWLFRLALFAFEWGGLWLSTMDNRFGHFVLLPPGARRRYVRFWMTHRWGIVRDLAMFLKMIVFCCAYDDRREAAAFGFAPTWMR